MLFYDLHQRCILSHSLTHEWRPNIIWYDQINSFCHSMSVISTVLEVILELLNDV